MEMNWFISVLEIVNRYVNSSIFGVIMYYVFILLWICNFDVDFVQKKKTNSTENAPCIAKKCTFVQ